MTTPPAGFDYAKAVGRLVRAGRTLAEVAELTDRQIVELFCEEEQAVALPAEKPASREEERAMLFGFGAAVGMSTDELEAAWRQKYPEG